MRANEREQMHGVDEAKPLVFFRARARDEPVQNKRGPWSLVVHRLRRRIGVFEHAAHPHGEPVEIGHLRRSLSFLLGWIASTGRWQDVDPAYAMLLSDDKEVIDSAVALVARKVGQWHAEEGGAAEANGVGDVAPRARSAERGAAGPSASGGARSDLPDLDEEAALRIALLDCESLARPVTANTVQSVEDDEYPGYWQRERRRFRLILWTLIALVFAIAGEMSTRQLYSGLEPWGLPDGVEYVLEGLRFFMWGMVGSGLYLLRRLYQFVKTRRFDPAMYGSYGVRLLMGGLAGMLIASMFFPLVAEPSEAVASEVLRSELLKGSAIAVVSGYGVRVVYAIFEGLVDGVSERIMGRMKSV